MAALNAFGEEAEEEEESPESSNLRRHLVISGIFDAGEESKSVAAIGITDIDGQLLLALPEFGWA